ncbi:MAG: hypothetical protein HZB11_01700 [Candidatus Yonathbacteria bacterium]|nr:hypothetical protein [Candidatus Yonathbacteria bacterium]
MANEVSYVMRKQEMGFDAAFAKVMQNYKNFDWATTRREVGSILGKRKRRERKKSSTAKQLNLFPKNRRGKVLEDAAKSEASLVVGIPEDDR